VDSRLSPSRFIREGNRFVVERSAGVLSSIKRACVIPDLLLGSALARRSRQTDWENENGLEDS
jgi:hypothetical protein